MEHLTDFSTKHTVKNLPFWVYTYVPNGSLLDSTYYFGNPDSVVHILCLEEPYLFEPVQISIEEFKVKFANTKVKVYSSYYGGPLSLKQHIEKNEKLSGDNIERIHFPLFFLYFTFHLNPNINFNAPKSYIPNPDKHFTFLANQPRLHRLVMLDKLAKYDLLKSTIYSFNTDKTENSLKHTVSHNLNYRPTYFDFKKHTPEQDKGIAYTPEPKFSCTVQRVHTDSALSIASETVYETAHFTEKTFLPLLMGKPVLIHGGPNSNKILKEFGFKLHDKIIDYEFDSKESIVDRTELLCRELNRLKNTYSEQQLYVKLKDIANFNRGRAREIIFNRKYIPVELLDLDSKFEKEGIWKTGILRWYYKSIEKIKSYEQEVTKVSEGSMGKQVKAEPKE
jgi:hypothetical protein